MAPPPSGDGLFPLNPRYSMVRPPVQALKDIIQFLDTPLEKMAVGAVP